ncbi:hypothetical protein DMJ13_17070 [halophilic archaeon]|nr:hypothetical protein DMJ13_17070 [halophilic archaeon]
MSVFLEGDPAFFDVVVHETDQCELREVSLTKRPICPLEGLIGNRRQVVVRLPRDDVPNELRERHIVVALMEVI